MQTKLQELTEKIYQEGIIKANEQAENIITEAKREAQSLVNAAKKEAGNLLNNAEKEASETRKNAMNELHLAGRQAISDLKQKVVALIEAEIIRPETKDAFKQPGFIPEIIRTIVGNWNPGSGEAVNLEVVLPADKQHHLDAYFGGKAAGLLEKGLEVSFSEKVKGGFKIGPKDGGYQISFTDEDFDHFFQAYLRPRLIDLLFGKKQ